ncbi:MAG: NADH-quinone oxidoreductase subunit A [Coriobacteriia bacterium]|nr:NADH-quinone oxidoreductase subunit A [Coriobacteriia bacterium]
MNEFLMTPPAIFMILLAVIGLAMWASRGLSPKGSPTPGKEDPYACGQDVPSGRYQPGYADFFQFAFLFTILDVATLMIGTVVAGGVWLTVLVLGIVVLALIILFRRD